MSRLVVLVILPMCQTISLPTGQNYIEVHGLSCANDFCPQCGMYAGVCDKYCAFCVAPEAPSQDLYCFAFGTGSDTHGLQHVDMEGAQCSEQPSDEGFVAMGTVCTVRCDEGYDGDPQEFSCDSDEQWHLSSAAAMPCTLRTCPNFSTQVITTGHMHLVADCIAAHPGAVCEAACDRGYLAQRGTSSVFTCDATGTWQGDLICDLELQLPVGLPVPEPEPEPLPVPAGGEGTGAFDPSECFVGDYTEERCCDRLKGPEGDPTCWSDRKR